MQLLNDSLTRLFDGIAGLLAGSPAGTLLVCSAVAGVLMTLVFRHTSSQKGLRAAGRRVRGTLLCMRLFRDDLRTALRCHLELFRATGWRLWLSLPPLAVLCLPVLLVMVQLALRLERLPLRPGDAAVVELRLSEEAWPAWSEAALVAPEGVRVETPALRDRREKAIYWRIRLLEPTSSPLRFQCGEAAIEKELASAADPGPLRVVSAVRPGSGLIERLLHPGEPGLASDAPARSIAIRYPARATPILGLEIPWWATFFIVTILVALVARPFLKVHF